MLVEVTKEDIEQGKPARVQMCPVALALKRVKPRSTIYMGTWTVSINGRAFTVPARVTRFVMRFDEGKRVRPFTFDTDELQKD